MDLPAVKRSTNMVALLLRAQGPLTQVSGILRVNRPRMRWHRLNCSILPAVPRARRVGKNNCVFALIVLCSAINAISIFAAAPDGPPTSSQLLGQGRKLLEAGRLAEAELILDRAAKFAPSDSVILTLDAEVKGRLGEYSESVALLKRVVRLIPQSAQAHVDLAIALADSGDLSSALAEITTAISIAPRLAIAHLNRARILSDLKQDREAEDEFAMATKLAPTNPDCYFHWSQAELALGNSTKEMELLQKVVKLQPGNLNAHIKLADALLDQDRTSEAVAELRIAQTIDPNSPQALYKLTRALHATDPAESAQLRSRFDQLKGRNSITAQAKVLANQAFHAFTVQDWRESIRLYGDAMETCGDCEIESALHRNLGLTLYRDGQLERSAEELRKALALNPDDRDAAKALEIIRTQSKVE